jgi:SAM-dependent methyltransferase
MPQWMDVSDLSFNNLLLLEQVQLSWLPGWLPEREFQIALKANPVVEWYIRRKCPQLNEWLDRLMSSSANGKHYSAAEIRESEVKILSSMMDFMVYALDPSVYDAQPFLNWDSTELLALADFTGKTVIDIGTGTGRLALTVADTARFVFAIEPVASLRTYLKEKTRKQQIGNVYVLDGLITDIPFPNQFADITMGGHVFGADLIEEYNEMMRVTKSGGMIILCPGNNDMDNDVHQFLVSHGFEWSRFNEPQDGVKRKYWKTVE